MTHQELDHLFASARTAPAQTSVEEVTAWVGAAAITTTGVLGVAAKVKLFIAKKSLLMLGSVLGTVGVVTVATTMLVSSPTPESSETNALVGTGIQDEPSERPEPETIEIIYQQEDSLEAPEVPEIVEPLAPVAPVIVIPEPCIISAPCLAEVECVEVKMADVAVRVVAPKEPEIRIGVAPVKIDCEDKKSVKGSGNVTTENHAVKSFKRLEINGAFDIILRQGDKESVMVETDDNLHEYIMIDQSGDLLELNNKGGVNIKKSTKMNIYVTVKNLTHIYSHGVGDITTENQLKGKKFVLEMHGVGDAELDISYSNLLLEYSGVGDVTLKGSANDVMLECSGVGDVDTYALKAHEVSLEHSGVGDADIFADQTVSIEFSGIGDVNYKGNPETKEIEKVGIGSVKAR